VSIVGEISSYYGTAQKVGFLFFLIVVEGVSSYFEVPGVADLPYLIIFL
jgi:hypothetical protein